MILGYARVSTQEQSIDLQLDALNKAGCDEVYQEKYSGKSRNRPELEFCLRTLREGDVLVVWKLDRLARSLKDLVDITNLKTKESDFALLPSQSIPQQRVVNLCFIFLVL